MTSLITVAQAKTLDGLFSERVLRSPQTVAYRYYDAATQAWGSHTWKQMNLAVARWQAALSKEALIPGDRVAVMLKNCPEWVMFEQAALGMGLVVVPLYVDDRPENAAYTLTDAGVKLLLLGSQEQWQGFVAIRSQIKGLQRVVIVSGFNAENIDKQDSALVVLLNNWLPAGAREVQHVNIDSHSLATIIYTSGTSGRPKGVMLSHHNILTNAASCAQIVPISAKDLLLSFLPLSHTFERTVGYYIPMMCGATIVYARSIQQLQEDLLSIRPTMLVSVPRIYEKIYASIRTKLAEGSKLHRWLFNFAVEVGYTRFEYQQGRGPKKLVHFLWPLLDKLVAKKLMGKLGGRLRQVTSGGAALSADVSRVFIGLGLPILQGFGMTETSPVACANRLSDNLPTSVGRPIPGVQVKLGENDALLIYGPNVMLGYWNNPDATNTVKSADGWLDSGDIASIDAQGRVTITGRLKEIIVLSTGEKIPPADMEAAILRNPLFEQVILIGEARPYLSMLVVLNTNLYKAMLIQSRPNAYLTKSLQQQTEEILLEKITNLTHEFPGYVRIRRIAVISTPWTVENDMLTPTLKVKRSNVLHHYRITIEELYAGH